MEKLINTSRRLTFAFWGTPKIASETLEILKESGFLPSLIITSPDRPQGRKMTVTPPPVKVWAVENNIPYLQPENFMSRTVLDTLSKGTFDISVVVAYGKIIPEEILDMPKFGSINVHYSLLPKYRGASPVESAVLNGETETGVSIQKMEYKMDTGPILAAEKTEIGKDEKAPELKKRLTKIGGELLIKLLNTTPTLDKEGGWEGVKQDESQATYCKKIKKEDGLVNLEAELPITLYNKFRAYAEWPRIFFFRWHLPAGRQERVIITDASLEDGKFAIKKVLPEGRKEITWEEFKKNYSNIL